MTIPDVNETLSWEILPKKRVYAVHSYETVMTSIGQAIKVRLYCLGGFIFPDNLFPGKARTLQDNMNKFQDFWAPLMLRKMLTKEKNGRKIFSPPFWIAVGDRKKSRQGTTYYPVKGYHMSQYDIDNLDWVQSAVQDVVNTKPTFRIVKPPSETSEQSQPTILTWTEDRAVYHNPGSKRPSVSDADPHIVSSIKKKKE